MDMSVMKIFRKTLPFFISRLLVYAIFAVAAFVFLGIMIGVGFLVVKMFGESAGAFIIVMIIAFGIVYGGLRFVERYVLYMVKIGHISVIVELLKNGKVPDGKGQVTFGKNQVTNNFGSTNVAFVLDNLVHGAVKQIQRRFVRIGEMFSFIPGSKNIVAILNAVMSVSLNYIDEAIMSYIFIRKSEKHEESVWKSAVDGVVLYAQSWKSVLKTAAGSVVFIYAFNIIIFLVIALPLMFVSSLLSANTPEIGFLLGALALIAAYVVTTVLKRALVDPIVTIAMIRSYQISIRDMEPQVDVHSKLLGLSSKFKELVQKETIEEDEAIG